MNIQDNPSFLLFVEPTGEATIPVIDTYTRKIAGAFRKALKGTSGYGTQQAYFLVSQSGYRGSHSCSCEHASSSNQDYLIQTKNEASAVKLFLNNAFFSGDESKATTSQAVITNSLCIHYVACHRKDISEDILSAIVLLEGEEVEPTAQELFFEKEIAVKNNNLR